MVRFILVDHLSGSDPGARQPELPWRHLLRVDAGGNWPAMWRNRGSGRRVDHQHAIEARDAERGFARKFRVCGGRLHFVEARKEVEALNAGDDEGEGVAEGVEHRRREGVRTRARA
mgnify:CR=1 FL=1